MKIEIYLNGEGKDEGEDDMPKKPTAFHKKVALMLAKQKGRSKANEMDLEKAMELDEDDES
jgi:hypothetical protein